MSDFSARYHAPHCVPTRMPPVRTNGVSDEAISHAAANAIRVVETDDGLFIVGADASGLMLELVGRPSDTGDLIVFHALPLRAVNATGTCHEHPRSYT